VAQALLPAGSIRLPGCPQNAEMSLRTPEVAPQFRGGEEIDLSQFWHRVYRSLRSRLGNAMCRY
jgi:hypothetical protein